MVYDFLLSIGVRPFVEIGFMPEDLARERSQPLGGKALDLSPGNTRLSTPVFWWKANVTAPKSWERWDNLVAATVQHWSARYGTEEVKRWYFEIWNEPNHHGFFIPVEEAKRREEYFTLYTHRSGGEIRQRGLSSRRSGGCRLGVDK